MVTLLIRCNRILALPIKNGKNFTDLTRRVYSSSVRPPDEPPRYYTKKHEWVSLEKDIGTVGISNYAQVHLGDIVFVQLPKVGDDVNTTDECGALESVKAASEVYSPVSGTVTEINESLENSPNLVNDDCYGSGWLFKLKLKDPSEIENLMKEVDYKEYTDKEESS